MAMQFNSVTGLFSILIEILMIILNMLPIYVGVWFKERSELTTTDELIITMSCSTIGVVLFSTPFGLMSYFNHVSGGGGVETCRLFQVSSTLYQMFSILLLSTMILNKVHKGRLITTFKYPQRVWSRRTTLLILACLFLLSLFVAILPVVGLVPSVSGLTNVSCHLWVSLKTDVFKEETFFISYLSVGYLNLVCVVVCLPIVFHLIRKVKRQLCIDCAMQDSNFILERDVHRRNYVTSSRMVSLLTAMFYFSWVPTLVMITIDKAGYPISETAILYAMLGTSLTGLMNPLVYAFQDKQYRHGYRHALQQVAAVCLCRRKPFHHTAALSMTYTTHDEARGSVSSETAADPIDTGQPGSESQQQSKRTSEEDTIVMSRPPEGGVINVACEDLEFDAEQFVQNEALSRTVVEEDSLELTIDNECAESALIAGNDIDPDRGVYEASILSSSSGSTSDASLDSFDNDYYEESAM